MATRMTNPLKHFALILALTSFTLFCGCFGLADEPDEYIQVAGLFDIHTNFSDGAHSLDYLIKLAEKRDISVLFVSDHPRVTIEYGLRPFQNILKKRVDRPSINKGGAANFLNMIQNASKNHPEMILIPGAEAAPFYYWRGSFFKKNLTACDWERHLLIIGLTKPQDYEELPILHNSSSRYYARSPISIGLFLLLIPFLAGLYLLKKPGILRYFGVMIIVFSLLLIINNHVFKRPPYDQYHGPQGISPYQLLINDVNSRGGMIFWNHPETRSGQGKLGPIFKETLPYPQLLLESRDYTGFSALYGDTITLTEPGNIWDQVLTEYCLELRKKPVWGISTADFHKEGEAGEKLGNFPTVFLVKNKTKDDILESLRNGRMYSYLGDITSARLALEEFSISAPGNSHKEFMGGEIISEGYPRIKIRVSIEGGEQENLLTLRLIRFGKLIKTFSNQGLLDIDFTDEFFEPGKKIYYRLDLNDKRNRTIVSNPIFVKFQASRNTKSQASEAID
jgi:hypothetical protein